jgi:putative transposase
MATPATERKAVAHLREAFGMSERRACKAIDCCRITMRYRTTPGGRCQPSPTHEGDRP